MPGALGSSMAQQHLRNILAAVDVPVMGHPEAYLQVRPGVLHEDGRIDDEAFERFLLAWCDSLVRWIHIFRLQPGV